MGKPCESIDVRLRSVKIRNSKHQAEKGQNVPYQSATVLHIINSAKYSFINENLVRKLLPKAFPSNIPAIEPGNDTIVELEWHYPGVKMIQVTTHYMLRESHYQITLRKEDWERPMRNFLRQTFPEKQWRQRNAVSPPRELPPAETEDAKNEGSDLETCHADNGTDGGSESESDAASEPRSPRHSRTSTMITDYEAGECTDMCVGDRQGDMHDHKSECAAGCGAQGAATEEVNDTNQASGKQVQSGEHDCEPDEGASDWLQFEIIDTESEDEEGPKDQKEDPYWTWSQKDSRWFHKCPDGSTLWFPKLV